MLKLIVVEKPKHWNLRLEDVEVITPAQYINQEPYQSGKNLKILNLCKSYQYQSEGYYVSLLAEARGHKVLPEVSTIQDLRYPSILRDDSLDFDALIQTTFKNLTTGWSSTSTLAKPNLNPSTSSRFSCFNSFRLRWYGPVSPAKPNGYCRVSDQ
jgi:RimK-like ATPgrasp N-terminal domain